jgi:hypothetical protein
MAVNNTPLHEIDECFFHLHADQKRYFHQFPFKHRAHAFFSPPLTPSFLGAKKE